MSLNFVAIDFETANAKRNSACALGLVHYSNGHATEKHWLIKPEPLEFDRFNISIHGITPEDVKSAPTFDVVWDELKPYLNNNVVIAHNAAFDMSVLRCLLDQYDLDYPNCDYICTLKLTQKIYPNIENHKLSTLADYFQITHTHHNAQSDAYAASELLVKILENKNINEIRTLASQTGVTIGKIYHGGYEPCSTDSSLCLTYDFSCYTPPDPNPFHSKIIVCKGKLTQYDLDTMRTLSYLCDFKLREMFYNRTDILVFGNNTYRKFLAGDYSEVMLKALELKKRGTLKIMSESEFFQACNLPCSDVTSKKSSKKKKQFFSDIFSKYDTPSLLPCEEAFDKSHPLYAKTCVITGSLERLNRKETAQIIASFGGFPGKGITKKTDYLIIGNLKDNPLVLGEKSSKQLKAEEYIQSGIDIKILSEDEFYLMAGITSD